MILLLKSENFVTRNLLYIKVANGSYFYILISAFKVRYNSVAENLSLYGNTKNSIENLVL